MAEHEAVLCTGVGMSKELILNTMVVHAIQDLFPGYTELFGTFL